jgi:hypothetical protein
MGDLRPHGFFYWNAAEKNRYLFAVYQSSVEEEQEG